MANYAALFTDNADGTFTITTLMRAPTTTTITGGTSLLTDTYSQNAATGALTSASGFKVTTNTSTLRSPAECFERSSAIVRNDRSFNS
jgi:hypothetical protein